jgi:hypothetical protein
LSEKELRDDRQLLDLEAMVAFPSPTTLMAVGMEM